MAMGVTEKMNFDGGAHLVAAGAVQDLCLTLNNVNIEMMMIWKSDPLFFTSNAS